MTPLQLKCKILIDTNILIDYIENINTQHAKDIFLEIEKYVDHDFVHLAINHFTYLEAFEVRKKEHYMQHMVYTKGTSIKRANSNANQLKHLNNTTLKTIVDHVKVDLQQCTQALDVLGSDAKETLLALREEVEYLLQNTTISYKDSLIVAYAKILSANYIISGDAQLIQNDDKFLNDAIESAGLERETYPCFLKAENFQSIEEIYFNFFKTVLAKEIYFQVVKPYSKIFTIGLVCNEQESPFQRNTYIYIYNKKDIMINQYKILDIRFHHEDNQDHNLTLCLEPINTTEPNEFKKQTQDAYVFLATL